WRCVLHQEVSHFYLATGVASLPSIDKTYNRVGSSLKCDLQMITMSYPMPEAFIQHAYSHIDLDERRKIAHWCTANLIVGVL
ncbi:hypothetical protein ACI0FS_04005, partial [Ochrobactrum quorumnocens]